VKKLLETRFREHREILEAFLSSQTPVVIEAGRLWKSALQSGRKVLFCGNGGSAADSQHLAAELAVRFYRNRGALAALALTTDTSVLTAAANDMGVESIFSRQIEALGRKGDVLVAMTTSGRSANILEALKEASRIGMKRILMTGQDGSALEFQVDVCITVPSRDTPRIQEVHALVGHLLCEWVEAELDTSQGAR